jgi:hypothetical protein
MYPKGVLSLGWKVSLSKTGLCYNEEHCEEMLMLVKKFGLQVKVRGGILMSLLTFSSCFSFSLSPPFLIFVFLCGGDLFSQSSNQHTWIAFSPSLKKLLKLQYMPIIAYCVCCGSAALCSRYATFEGTTSQPTLLRTSLVDWYSKLKR